MAEAVLEVQRDRIVDRAADALGLQVRLQLVAPLDAQRVLVEDVLIRGIDRRRLHLRQAGQRPGVIGRMLAAPGGPGREVRQLGEQHGRLEAVEPRVRADLVDRKSTRLNSSHLVISYAVFCLKKKKQKSKHQILE